MRPQILTGYRNYEVVYEITETRYQGMSRQYKFNNQRTYGWVTANSAGEAWELANKNCRKDRKPYGLRNSQTKEFYYPSELVYEIQQERERSEEIPF